MFEVSRGANGTIELHGRLDASCVAAAAAVFEEVTEPCTVDCAELTYISSAGLGVLFATQRRLVDTGAGLRLVNLNRHLREIFQIAGFDRVFDIG